ncbi:MAG: methionine synthase [Actinobacteria bacterium]|nr:MAG: methionine synthase [Actinomycetota bacterium]
MSETNNQQPTTNNQFKPKCMATAIGSLPNKNADDACKLVLANLVEAPMWPQLPKLSYKENMYVQYSQGMPSMKLVEAKETVVVVDDPSSLEEFYQKYLEEDIDYFAISKEYAAGLYKMLELAKEGNLNPPIIKGQITGPISFALTIKEESTGKSILFNETYADAITKCLAMKAKWQEKVLKESFPNSRTMIFVDEPYLASFGSAFMPVNAETVIEKLNDCFDAISGLKGIHVCGGTDWSMIMKTKAEVIHFDAYDFFEGFSAYPQELNAFLDKGGMVGFGIIPNNNQVEQLNASFILEQFEYKIDKLRQLGVDVKLLLEKSFVAPNCGCGTMSEDQASKALILTRELSELLRAKYF